MPTKKKQSTADDRPPRKPGEATTTGNPTANTSPSSRDDRWWELIERSRKGAEGNDEQAQQLVTLLTAELSGDEILEFDKFLHERVRDAFRSDLWAIAYIMNGGCSDDGFDYFLGWLICKGRQHYEAALVNPEHAANGVGPDGGAFENEVVFWGPARAWAAKTGNPHDDYFKFAPSVPRSLQGELFDEDTVHDEHPEIAKKFGG